MKPQALRSLLDQLDESGGSAKAHPFEIGKAYFFRTVTYHMVGRVVATTGSYLTLDDAAWIADSGRFADAIAKGEASEIEPVGRCYVNIDSITDAEPWNGKLPLPQK